GWDLTTFYDERTAFSMDYFYLNDMCYSDDYHGASAGSEPEAQNIQQLIDAKKINFFMDIHSRGRLIIYPWGIAWNQSDTPTMNFQNADWNRGGAAGQGKGRGAKEGGNYKEYLPDKKPFCLLDRHHTITNRIREGILQGAGRGKAAKERSAYKPIQSVDI